MPRYDTAVLSGTVVIPYLGAVRCDIGVRDGRIAALADSIASGDNKSGPYRTIFPEVVAATTGHAYTDFGYHIGVMTTEQLDEVDWLVAARGVGSFKYYMFFRGLCTVRPRDERGRGFEELERSRLVSGYTLATARRRGQALWYQVEPSLM